MSRISTSPLTGRIFCGRIDKDGKAWVGQKQDVTSDVLRALIEKAEYHGGAFDVVASDGSKYVVTVKQEPTP